LKLLDGTDLTSRKEFVCFKAVQQDGVRCKEEGNRHVLFRRMKNGHERD